VGDIQTTIFISKLLGSFSVITGASMLVAQGVMLTVFREISQSRVLLYFIGLAHLLGGLILVLIHNIWAGNVFQTLVSIIGWLMLCEGLIYVLIDKKQESWLFGRLRTQKVYFAVATFYLLVGVYLAVFGFWFV
jgi:vacuolar-type H+-ATPase subunit I/STV1